MSDMNRTEALIRDLISDARETHVVEFKTSNANPKVIAKLISALSNSACLAGANAGYVLWGVNDDTRAIVGTDFDPTNQSHKGSPLLFWLSQQLEPAPNIEFEDCVIDGQRLVLLTIPATVRAPVEFEHIAYIRIDSATPRLSGHPEKQQALWAKLQTQLWEEGIAANFVKREDVIRLLDYQSYFKLTGQSEATSTDHALDSMVRDKLIRLDVGGRYDILNLGAILFAHRLSDFSDTLKRKALRFVSYDGKGRDGVMKHSLDGDRGFAVGLSGFLEYLNNLLPINEYISGAFREENKLFPELAIRELVANALMHQDMTVGGASPLVELFDDRLEISNPGTALIPTHRFLDAPPLSRNDRLAGLMRRMRLCEQLGTGIDKVVTQAELYQLPPPDFRQELNSVRAVLYAPRSFSDMSPEERIRACDQHAVLQAVNGQRLTNASLRTRFGLDDTPSATSQVSKVIRAAREDGLIKADDTGGSNRYLPNRED